jgi:hypothetical protein
MGIKKQGYTPKRRKTDTSKLEKHNLSRYNK